MSPEENIEQIIKDFDKTPCGMFLLDIDSIEKNEQDLDSLVSTKLRELDLRYLDHQVILTNMLLEKCKSMNIKNLIKVAKGLL